MDVALPVAFPHKIQDALAAVARKITHDGQSHTVVGIFLQHFAGEAAFEAKELGCYVFFVQDDLVESLVVYITQQVQTVLRAVDEDAFAADFGDA